MRALKVVGIILLLLVAVLFVFIISLPDTAHMERKTIIEAPPHKIYQELITFRNYGEWWPWALKESEVKSVREGSEFGVGAKLMWNSADPDSGLGYAEIVKAIADSLVAYKMGFEGYKGDPEASFQLIPTSEGTEVIWNYDEVNIRGLSKIFVRGIDGFLGGNYQAGLQALKERIESAPHLECTISPVLLEGFSYLGIKDTIMNDPAMINTKMAQDYGVIVAYLQKKAIEPTGAPIAVLSGYSDTNLTFTCGVPVPESTEMPQEDDLQVFRMDSSLVIKAKYVGNYDGLEKAHLEVHKYAGFHNYQIVDSPWEEYVTDPESEPDTSLWQTNVYYPAR